MSLKNKNKDKNAKKSTYVRSSVSINAVPIKKDPYPLEHVPIMCIYIFIFLSQ